MQQKPQQNELKRKLGLFPVTNIVIANMIGAGIFITSGLLMADLHNPLLMVFLWLVGGVIALCGALCYGELGAAFPEAGGEYVFLSKLFHPMFGFLSGWISFIVGFSAPIAASSRGVSAYFTRALPQSVTWAQTIGIVDPQVFEKLLSMGVILIFTLIHLRGIQFGAAVQNVLTILKVILIAGLLACGGFIGKGNTQHFAQGGHFSFDFGGMKTLGLSIMWIMFAYSGWNAATYIGSEVNNPKKNIPLSLIAGTSIVMILYIGLNILFVYAVPPDTLKGVISVGGLTAGKLFGGPWERIFSIFISFALFSSLSAYIILGPRIYYAMAKNGHFFNFVSKVNHRSHVPTYSILVQALLAIIMVMSGTFDQILTYMGFSLGIFPILAVLGVFKVRKAGLNTTVSSGYPVVPLVYIIAAVSILVLAYFERPVESSIALGTVILGIPMYYFFIRQKRSAPAISNIENLDKNK